jgi:hypothetical protein
MRTSATAPSSDTPATVLPTVTLTNLLSFPTMEMATTTVSGVTSLTGPPRLAPQLLDPTMMMAMIMLTSLPLLAC